MAEASSSLSVTETVTQEVCYVQERDFFFFFGCLRVSYAHLEMVIISQLGQVRDMLHII